MPTYLDGSLVFIHIPKCAGKSVRHSLKQCQLSAQPESRGEPLVYRWHESLSEVHALFREKWNKEKFEQATIIATIRHPIERAVSYWKYTKRINMLNFHNHDIARKIKSDAPKLNFRNVVVPYFAPEDSRSRDTIVACEHCTNYEYVKQFDSLSFDDYVSSLTEWKTDGCNYVNCPYHMLEPQVLWLRDVNGDIKMDKLSLFLVENLNEIESLVPEAGKISNQLAYFETKQSENHTEHLTTKSLKILKNLYADDFKLYKTLKTNNLEAVNA